MKRRKRDWGAAGFFAALLGVAVAWLVGAKAASLPMWPAYVIGAVALAGCYLTLAPLRWTPFKDQPATTSGKHRKQLCGIAETLRERIDHDSVEPYEDDGRDPQLAKSIFEAHFPTAGGLVASFVDETQRWKDAKVELRRNALVDMTTQFDPKDGWDRDEIARGFRAHEGGIAWGKGPGVEEEDSAGTLIWDERVVFCVPDVVPRDARFSTLVQAAVSFTHWLDSARTSDEAKTYQDAQPASRQVGEALVRALVPIIEGQPILMTKACVICNPSASRV